MGVGQSISKHLFICQDLRNIAMFILDIFIIVTPIFLLNYLKPYMRVQSDSSEFGWLDYSAHWGKCLAFILSGYF